MDEFHVLRPGWLALAPLGLALIAWAWRRTEGGGAWRAQCDPELLARLAVRRAAARPGGAPLLGALAVVIAAVALAGPSWSRAEHAVFRSDRATIVALDLSRSMDATDLSPSRLGRARFKIADLLDRTRDGQAGLVVYAGDAFVVAPLTDDAATLGNLLPALGTDLMPVQGSRADLGLERAGTLLAGAGARAAQVVLVSDGTDDPRAVTAARALADAGHRVSVLAVGSAEGAPVPLPGGGFLTDSDGNIVIPGLDSEGLAEIARAGGGVLTPITADEADLDILEGAAGPGRAARDAASRTTERWEDQGPWLVLALLPLAALGFRRGWLVVLALWIVPPQAARALGPGDLWARPDQQAAAALERGDAAHAASVAKDARWQAPARYREGEYGQAASSYATILGPDARYNQGNALARAGKLREALAAYDQALAEAPGHDDATFNRALVERLLEAGGGNTGGAPPEPGGEQAPGEEPSEQRSGAGSEDPDPGPGEGTEGEQAANDGGADGQPGEQRASGDETRAGMDGDEPRGSAETPPAEGSPPAENGPDARDEDTADAAAEREGDAEARQAMEQWMRRVPDDPGGLLRRKFALEHRRRGGAVAAESAW